MAHAAARRPTCDDIKPIVQAGGSDTAALDNVFELLVRAGRDAPMAKAMLIPESIGNERHDAGGAPATSSSTATR